VPRYRDVATILSTKSALMEPPPPSFLDGMHPADGVDWTKFSGGTLSNHMGDMATFGQTWAPLERRWEVEGAPAITPFSALCLYYGGPSLQSLQSLTSWLDW
jgi:hypothetical protein